MLYFLSDLYNEYKFNIESVRRVVNGVNLEKKKGDFLKLNKELFLELLERFFVRDNQCFKEVLKSVLEKLEKLY